MADKGFMLLPSSFGRRPLDAAVLSLYVFTRGRSVVALDSAPLARVFTMLCCSYMIAHDGEYLVACTKTRVFGS